MKRTRNGRRKWMKRDMKREWREEMKKQMQRADETESKKKKDLQSTFKKKSSEDEIPWAFLAEHQYLPLDDRLTLWRTRDWLEMMIPEEGSLNRDLPSKNQITSVTQGLALTTHSKYTSVPSRMLLPSILAPKIIFTWGGSVLLSKKEGEKNEVTKRVKMMRKSQSVSRWASTSATIYNKQWLPWITPWIANFFQGIRLVSKREKKMKNHWIAWRHKGISRRRARCMCVGVNLHDGRKERTRERKRKEEERRVERRTDMSYSRQTSVMHSQGVLSFSSFCTDETIGRESHGNPWRRWWDGIGIFTEK